MSDRIVSPDDPRVREAKAEIRSRSLDGIEQKWTPTTFETRETETEAGWQIVGHAFIYNSRSEDLGGFREQIAPGAAAAVLRSRKLDTRALFNHNVDYVLGRTKSRTLSLEDRAKGLGYLIDPPATTYADNLRVLLDRGDVDQSSFAFRVARNGEKWEEAEGGLLLRTITKFSALFDVSVVTMPAYVNTDAGIASSPLIGRMKADDEFPLRAALDRALKRYEQIA